MARGSPRSTERWATERQATERWSGGAPLIVTALLLAGAGGVVLWLHLTDRLAPLVAGTPSILVELPMAASPGEPAAEAPVASAELTVAPAEPPAETPAAAQTPEPVPASPPPAPPATQDQPAGTPAPEQSAPEPAPAVEAPAAPAAPQQAEPELATPAPPPAEAPADAAPPPAPPAPQLDPPEPPAGSTPQQAERQPDAPAPETEAPPAPAAEPTPPEESSAEAPDQAPTAPAEASPAEAPQTAMAWQRLARPFPEDETRPRIAVVVAGLGLSEAATTAAIQQLPAEITLSFSPYSSRLDEFVAMARAAGHEVLIDLPMEPASFPRDDPGPRALLTSLDEAANAERLAWTLGRTDGYLGVATYMGSRFTTSPPHLRPVLEELDRRGLLLLDSRAAADSVAAKLAAEEGVAHAINDRFIDNEASRVAIDGRLQQIERIARTDGVAVAMGYAYPVTIERLTEWARGLSGEGLVLAPISAVANRQEVR